MPSVEKVPGNFGGSLKVPMFRYLILLRVFNLLRQKLYKANQIKFSIYNLEIWGKYEVSTEN